MLLAAMRWVSWQEALVGSIACFLLWLWLGRSADDRQRAIAAAAKELSFVAGLYTIWRLARMLPIAQEEGALDRARWIAEIQEGLRLPSELSLQHWTAQHEPLTAAVVWYYGVVHVPATIGFLVWLYIWYRDHYWRWRSVLVWTTLACLVIRFLRVAPPRFLPEYGFVDLSERIGFDVYGPVGTGASDQFAAMPSIHAAWAAIVAFGVVAAVRHPLRWLIWLHLPVTMYVVAATGHHWWLDGIVAFVFIGLAWYFDRWWREDRLAAVRVEPSETATVAGSTDSAPASR